LLGRSGQRCAKDGKDQRQDESNDECGRVHAHYVSHGSAPIHHSPQRLIGPLHGEGPRSAAGG
jgi:hypothetical protein